MKNRQVQILYGISGVQVLGLSIMAGGMEAGSVLAAVGTGILVIYATGLLAKESGRKKCPECGSLILKKNRICPECGYRYKEGIPEEKLMEVMVDTSDVLSQVDLMSQNLDNEVLEVQLLMDQISSSVLFQAVSSLDKLQKEILLLRIFYMKSFGEIGEMLGLTLKQAENTYYNSIRKIRKIIGGGKNGI